VARKQTVRRKPLPQPVTDPVATARAARLRYVNDDEPGIRRRRHGKGWTYLDPEGKVIRDRAVRARIEALAIPPAWTDVWICADDRGHIQATGRDAKGRKQYRYHPRWQEVRDQTKFERMLLFGQALPRIRERVQRDLSLPGLPREKVLAAVVALLGSTFIRIGNPEYARSNDSIGLTTMRDEHVSIRGSRIRFKFRGKSGREHAIDLSDRRLARIVKRCQDVEGQALFQYTDDDGNPRAVTSSDVNQYLREISNEEFSAKDFRTWGGTTLALSVLGALDSFENQSQFRQNVMEMYRTVAAQLGNTVAVCRKYYIHPAVLIAYEKNELPSLLDEKAPPLDETDRLSLSHCERVVMALLLQAAEAAG